MWARCFYFEVYTLRCLGKHPPATTPNQGYLEPGLAANFTGDSFTVTSLPCDEITGNPVGYPGSLYFNSPVHLHREDLNLHLKLS